MFKKTTAIRVETSSKPHVNRCILPCVISNSSVHLHRQATAPSTLDGAR